MRSVSQTAAMKCVAWCCLLGLVFVMPGCRSTATPDAEVSSAEISAESEKSDAPIATWSPSSFTDNAKLRVGTGPMDADAATDFSVTPSGLKYRVLRNSDRKKPTAADTVTVNYRGWLNSGNVFDSSYERGEPTTFPLGNVIAGWTEGMQLVGEGGMIELWVPSRLGYGERGSPGSIPPHSNLHFIVELVSVD